MRYVCKVLVGIMILKDFGKGNIYIYNFVCVFDVYIVFVGIL